METIQLLFKEFWNVQSFTQTSYELKTEVIENGIIWKNIAIV